MDNDRRSDEDAASNKQTELQSFLRLTGCYRRFIEAYAEVAAPLFGMTRDGVQSGAAGRIRPSPHSRRSCQLSSAEDA